MRDYNDEVDKLIAFLFLVYYYWKQTICYIHVESTGEFYEPQYGSKIVATD